MGVMRLLRELVRPGIAARGGVLAAGIAIALGAAGCSQAGAPGSGIASTTSATAPAPAKAPGLSTSRPAISQPSDAGSDAGAPSEKTGEPSAAVAKASDESGQTPPAITAEQAEAAQFVTAETRGAPEVAACRAQPSEQERIRCSLTRLLKDDGVAAKEAVNLHALSGHVVGVEVEQWMDGGYRGKLHLVPEPPVQAHRKHLEWVAQASADFETFFAGLASSAARPIRYRHRALLLRYFRSVGARTPSAFAYNWTVSYNVSGSLHRTADAVRETMFHEIFHLNDRAHGSWSEPALGVLYAGIASRCGTRIPCLTPYAPSETTIRGGTYYAFHPENGVTEYAAELALRYYREQRSMLLNKPLGKPPFKCGPPENAKAWDLLKDEFFGGVDLVPPCRAR
jgi:hypothetical protein